MHTFMYKPDIIHILSTVHVLSPLDCTMSLTRIDKMFDEISALTLTVMHIVC